jgi:hypothetical protein
MKVIRVFAAAAFLASWMGVESAPAAGWSLADLNPFAQEPARKAAKPKSAEPSALKKLDTQTKQFFSKTKDALSLKKPEPKSTVRPRSPWVRDPRNRQAPKKQSWLGSLFHREEPKPPQTLDDWMSLKRMDP